MSTNALFTPEQQDKLMKAMREMMNSKLLDPSNPPTTKERIDSYINRQGDPLKHYKPDAFNISKPEVWYGMIWEQYVSYLAIHDRPSNKKGTRRHDTTKKRSRPAKQLAKYLGRTPTAADLKDAFPTITGLLDDKICRIIDKDLKNITQLTT
jgi:hypothetical protein